MTKPKMRLMQVIKCNISSYSEKTIKHTEIDTGKRSSSVSSLEKRRDLKKCRSLTITVATSRVI